MITQDKLQEALEQTRLQTRARTVAKMIFIDGLSMAEAARRTGISKEAVRQIRARVAYAIRDACGLPRDWQVVTVAVPADVAGTIREIAHQAHDRYYSKYPQRQEKKSRDS